jgi:hypothetical protein
MTRLGASLVDCGGADQCAETPIAPNEMAAIQTDSRFIGVPQSLRPAASRAPHETTRARQWEQMFLMIFISPVVFPKEMWHHHLGFPNDATSS